MKEVLSPKLRHSNIDSKSEVGLGFFESQTRTLFTVMLDI